MRTNKKRGKELPEFNAEYIDKLFSLDMKGKITEILAPAEETFRRTDPAETPEPKVKKSRRKPILLLAAVALIVLLCLTLPNILANVQADRWQKRCEEAYLALVSQGIYHYKRTSPGGEYVSETEIWIHGDNQLSISDWVSFDQIRIELWMGPHRYSKVIEGENTHSKWKFKGSAVRVTEEYSDTLADGKYIRSTIRGSFTGTEVTFRHEKYGYKKLTFHFDASGTLVGLSAKSSTEGKPSTTVYTFLPTAEEEILATIQKYYEEATQ